MEQNLSQRLADLRKENKLSQEALAEKMGLSRQAISKWERGESAPDTENLILLSSIYGITLDELLHGKQTLNNDKALSFDLKPDDGIFEKAEENSQPKDENQSGDITENTAEGFSETENEEGFFESTAENILPPKKKKHAKKEKPPRLCGNAYKVFLKIPVIVIVPLIFVLIGVLKGVWHPTWLINLFIPIYYAFCFAMAARTKKSMLLRMPVFLVTVAAFLAVGILKGLWHPAWMMFFFDILYYWVALSVKKKKE